jgi:branched-chain amino acid transport system ATP-binding protein
MNILELRKVSKDFEGIKAVDDLSLSIREGIITSLIGPNGAGKTTIFNIITGFLKPDKGSIFYKNQEITSLPSHKIANLGIGRLFQDVRGFSMLSVLDNVLLAKKNQPGENPVISLFARNRMRKTEEENLKEAKKWIDFVGLSDKINALAADLSYGQQKLLSIARLLAGGAQLLLLDEPASGVHPEMLKKIQILLRSLVEHGKTVVIIEHNMRFVAEISDWVMLLDDGKLVLFGKPAEIMDDPTMEEAYLGVL